MFGGLVLYLSNSENKGQLNNSAVTRTWYNTMFNSQKKLRNIYIQSDTCGYEQTVIVMCCSARSELLLKVATNELHR